MSNLLVSLETVKLNSRIEANAEPSKLRQSVIEAQRVELKSMLGTRLFTLFYGAVDATGTLTGLTTVQQEFYDDYLIPLLSKYAEERYIYATHYQISNIGVTQTNTTNNKGATDEAVKRLAGMSRNDADLHAIRAKDFIQRSENYNDLGVYYWESNQQVTPARKVFSSMIYTGPHRSDSDCCPTR